jgi:signal transduction histidine kinase
MGIASTVAVTLLVAWVLVQALVVRPAIGEREAFRVRQALEAAELMRSGLDKREVEALRGIDLRVFRGSAHEPPPGEGWVPLETEAGQIWKRDGGKYDIAVWTGEQWAVLHEDLPIGSTLALAFLAAGTPLVFGLFGLTQRSQRHQDAVEEALSRLASGNLGVRLDEASGTVEVRRMAVAVNRMATQLEQLLASDRERVAGLSHELRTPLTRVRLELELARRDGGSADRLHRIERDIEAFDAMLQEMLELSRLQLVGQAQMQREVVDLDGLARFVLDERGWEDVDVRGEGTATVDPKLVTRLLVNLLGNSARHAPGASRWVEVMPDGLRVGDDGPGIPAASHRSVLEAFHRGDASSGHGLGLAIVTQIVALHEGRLEISKPPGLVVSVRFGRCPMADAHA